MSVGSVGDSSGGGGGGVGGVDSEVRESGVDADSVAPLGLPPVRVGLRAAHSHKSMRRLASWRTTDSEGGARGRARSLVGSQHGSRLSLGSSSKSLTRRESQVIQSVGRLLQLGAGADAAEEDEEDEEEDSRRLRRPPVAAPPMLQHSRSKSRRGPGSSRPERSRLGGKRRKRRLSIDPDQPQPPQPLTFAGGWRGGMISMVSTEVEPQTIAAGPQRPPTSRKFLSRSHPHTSRASAHTSRASTHHHEHATGKHPSSLPEEARKRGGVFVFPEDPKEKAASGADAGVLQPSGGHRGVERGGMGPAKLSRRWTGPAVGRSASMQSLGVNRSIEPPAWYLCLCTSLPPACGKTEKEVRRAHRRAVEAEGPPKPWFPSGALSLRHAVYLFLSEPDSSQGAFVFSNTVMFAILLSVISMCVESAPSLRKQEALGNPPPIFAALGVVEMVCVILFTIEFVGRALTVTATPTDAEVERAEKKETYLPDQVLAMPPSATCTLTPIQSTTTTTTTTTTIPSSSPTSRRSSRHSTPHRLHATHSTFPSNPTPSTAHATLASSTTTPTTALPTPNLPSPAVQEEERKVEAVTRESGAVVGESGGRGGKATTSTTPSTSGTSPKTTDHMLSHTGTAETPLQPTSPTTPTTPLPPAKHTFTPTRTSLNSQDDGEEEKGVEETGVEGVEGEGVGGVEGEGRVSHVPKMVHLESYGESIGSGEWSDDIIPPEEKEGISWCRSWVGDCTGEGWHRALLSRQAGRRCWGFWANMLNLIDLVAVLPFYVELLVVAFGGVSGNSSGFTALRVLRLGRVLRVLKLSRSSAGLRLIGRALRRSVDGLIMTVYFVILGMVLFGSLIYLAEGGSYDADEDVFLRLGPDGKTLVPTPFTSIYAGFYWVITTLTTVGYGDMVPTTGAGRAIAAILMIAGIVILALPITLISSNFAAEYAKDVAIRMQETAEAAKDDSTESTDEDEDEEEEDGEEVDGGVWRVEGKEEVQEGIEMARRRREEDEEGERKGNEGAVDVEGIAVRMEESDKSVSFAEAPLPKLYSLHSDRFLEAREEEEEESGEESGEEEGGEEGESGESGEESGERGRSGGGSGGSGGGGGGGVVGVRGLEDVREVGDVDYSTTDTETTSDGEGERSSDEAARRASASLAPRLSQATFTSAKSPASFHLPRPSIEPGEGSFSADSSPALPAKAGGGGVEQLVSTLLGELRQQRTIMQQLQQEVRTLQESSKGK